MSAVFGSGGITEVNIRTQILVAAVVICAMVLLINLIRKNRLELKYALLWFVLGIGILILCLFPSITEHVARFFGIGLPINLIFFAGFCFALIIIFSLSVAVSKMSVRVKRLTQELGLLRRELEELKRPDSDEKSGVENRRGTEL